MRRFTAFALLLLGDCKGPMEKIAALRDALVADDTAAVREAAAGAPRCSEQPPAVVAAGKPGPYQGCLTEIATALGSKHGFVVGPPDHAAAATAALVLVRDGRGDWLTHADGWLADVKNGRGTGHDALRLAVARKMAEGAPVVGRRIDDEAAAREALRAVVAAVPGACTTYWLLGSGATALPPGLDADHAACVQKDLARREGPGATYGSGTFRALEGAFSLWRETERALRMGLAQADPGPKATLEKKLAVIEAATRAIATPKMESTPSVAAFMGEVHAEAGVALFKSRDAGADGRAPAR